MLMNAAGVPEEEALHAIAPLAAASVANALRLGPTRALTGPVERGDAETVAAHCAALRARPDARGLYREAARQALVIAKRRGLDEAKASRIAEILERCGE